MKRAAVEIRSAREEDIDSIYSIGSNNSISWSRKSYAEELKTAFSVFIIAELIGPLEKEIIAFAVAWNVAGEIQLNNIAVKESFREEGIATALIDRVIALLRHENPEKIYCEVRERNSAARGFYRSLGFSETGMRKKYYGDDNAILLEKVLNK
ncbi:MAG: GNAT family N-acetyltransferase [bacterium]|nr:GNAT family N-acetyltransferase [bacterium]